VKGYKVCIGKREETLLVGKLGVGRLRQTCCVGWGGENGRVDREAEEKTTQGGRDGRKVKKTSRWEGGGESNSIAKGDGKKLGTRFNY